MANSSTRTPGSGVLLIYTGGTIGSVRKYRNDPDSPLKPAEPEELLQHLPEIKNGALFLEGHTIPVDLIALGDYVDSALITPAYWVEMATLIEREYDDYEGFVILHGTDTMAYTASALSFMFDHLAKPVILTGAQRPISAVRSDAAQNVITAIEIAAAKSMGNVVVPEVCIYFHDTLLRGCRATKFDADGYTGFTTPNYPPLGVAGSKIEISEDLIRRADGHALQVRTAFDDGVAVLEVSPLMNNRLLQAVLFSEGLRGVILKSYGAGNAPTGEFLDIVGAAHDRGVKIVDVTQCYAGTVRLGQYDVSTGLLERGVISGLDMTPEAAQTKLALLLADPSALYPPEEMMQVNLRGEMDESLFDVRFGAGTADPEATVFSVAQIPASKHFNLSRVVRATLRMTGITVEGKDEAELDLSLFLNRKKGAGSGLGAGFAGSRRVHWVRDDEEEPSLYLDVTDTVLRHLEEGSRNSVTVINVTGGTVSWTDLHLAIFTR